MTHAASFGCVTTPDTLAPPPPAFVPKLTLNCAQFPMAVERTPWIWYVTAAVPVGIVASTNFFSPDPPMYVNSPSAPSRRYTWYIVPVHPAGLAHFHTSSSEPSWKSFTLKPVG